LFPEDDDFTVLFWSASSDRLCIFIFANCSVSWEARKQQTVALSSTEAEYMALSDATKEAIYLRRFLKEVLDIDKQIQIMNDNQGARSLAQNPIQHSRTKHILGDSKRLWPSMAAMYENLSGNCVGRVELTFL
jgi:hypothetical protein